jgi:MinD-like ATPase involved in chromosome partitioning or flagellar assembly
LREQFDMVVVDCGVHLSDATTAVTDTADVIFLVTSATTPALKSLRLSSTLLEDLGVPGRRMEVILNHPDEHADFADAEIVANLTLRVAASLPNDSRTAVTALDSGEPFVFTKPKSGLGVGLRRLAADLAEKTATRGDVSGALVN